MDKAEDPVGKAIDSLEFLLNEELKEIEEAHNSCEEALAEVEAARAEVASLRHRLRDCVDAIEGMPHEMARAILEDDDRIADLEEEQRRLAADRDRLKGELRDAESRLATVASDKRTELTRLALRLREAHDKAEDKRRQVQSAFDETFGSIADHCAEVIRLCNPSILGPTTTRY